MQIEERKSQFTEQTFVLRTTSKPSIHCIENFSLYIIVCVCPMLAVSVLLSHNARKDLSRSWPFTDAQCDYALSPFFAHHVRVCA